MRVVDLIIKKKEGLALSKEEIHFLINGYVKGEIPDYQISSLLMSICFQGLNEEEETNLTLEMLASGEILDLSDLGGIVVDKHSTGGVGDKTTLIIAPILAACGLIMAKMSGRGLGHTGGTIDKLEAIPGFRVALSSEEFRKQLKEIGLAVVGQTANIAPADKLIYALRDVTGTVNQTSLIASSVMSKKLASGADYLLLDVKVGDGAFMKTLDDAKKLAKSLVRIGNNAGKMTTCLLTNMDEPLGISVGNSLEVIESIETLKGRGPKDLVEVIYAICTNLLLMTNKAVTLEEATAKVTEVIENGSALNKLRAMIKYQGGEERVVDDYSLFPQVSKIVEVRSESAGYIKRIHSLEIGNISMKLGAGRANKNDVLDLAVGIKILKKVGEYVNANDVIAELYVNKIDSENFAEIMKQVKSSYEFQNTEIENNQVILGLIK